MDKIGLINSITNVLEDKWLSYIMRSQTREELLYSENLSILHDALKNLNNQNNILLFMTTEQIILHDDLQRYANAPEEVNSINIALVQLNEAMHAIHIVKNKEQYRVVSAVFSSKNKEAGLPLDAFRMFIKSHTARLTNRLTAPLSVSEKDVLRQRKENLKKARTLYIELQRSSLTGP